MVEAMSSMITSRLAVEVTAAELFQLCDYTGDGVVTLQDLQKVAKDLPLNEEELSEVFKTLDPKNLGTLSQREFIEALEKYVNEAISRKNSLNQDVSSRHEDHHTVPLVFDAKFITNDYIIAETHSSSSSTTSSQCKDDFYQEDQYREKLIQVLQNKLAQEQADRRLLEATLAERDKKHKLQLSAILSEAEEQVKSLKRRDSANKLECISVAQYVDLQATIEKLNDSKVNLTRQNETLQLYSRRLTEELLEKEREIGNMKLMLVEHDVDRTNLSNVSRKSFSDDNNNNNKRNSDLDNHSSNKLTCESGSQERKIKRISRSTSIDQILLPSELQGNHQSANSSQNNKFKNELLKTYSKHNLITQCQCVNCSTILNNNSEISDYKCTKRHSFKSSDRLLSHSVIRRDSNTSLISNDVILESKNENFSSAKNVSAEESSVIRTKQLNDSDEMQNSLSNATTNNSATTSLASSQQTLSFILEKNNEHLLQDRDSLLQQLFELKSIRRTLQFCKDL